MSEIPLATPREITPLITRQIEASPERRRFLGSIQRFSPKRLLHEAGLSKPMLRAAVGVSAAVLLVFTSAEIPVSLESITKPSTAEASPLAAVEHYNFNALVPTQPGYFGAQNSINVLRKFEGAHTSLTGESVNANLANLINPLGAVTKPAEGICNGLSAYLVLRPTTISHSVNFGGQYFTPEEIVTVGAALHYGDAEAKDPIGGKIFTIGEKSQANYLHALLFYRLSGEEKGFIFDRSSVPSEMWTHGIDQASVDVTDIGGGWIRVNANLRASDYADPGFNQGGWYRYFNVVYRVMRDDINYPGQIEGGNVNFRKAWVPDPTRFRAGYQVRGNVFTPGMEKTFSALEAAGA